MLNNTRENLSFNPLSFSDAGGYTCEVTVMSDLLNGSITNKAIDPRNITLTCKNDTPFDTLDVILNTV